MSVSVCSSHIWLDVYCSLSVAVFLYIYESISLLACCDLQSVSCCCSFHLWAPLNFSLVSAAECALLCFSEFPPHCMSDLILNIACMCLYFFYHLCAHLTLSFLHITGCMLYLIVHLTLFSHGPFMPITPLPTLHYWE